MKLPHSSMTARAGLRPERGGFTLFEILLVIAILVIVGAIAYPSFSAWSRNQRLQEATDVFQTGCVRARTRALEEGRPYRLQPGSSDGSFQVFLAPHADLYDETPGWEEEILLPRGVRFANVEWAVEFKPDGTARVLVEGAEFQIADIVLQDVDNPDRQRVLRIRALTGTARVVTPRMP
jgi:prepilin-type N-terminal cleavage/methylation domain-containing protein